MRKYLIAALVAGTAAVPAFAQDATSPFTGPRVGVLAGFDSIGAGSDEASQDDENDQSVEGFLYGVEAGYDADLGGAVVGVEAELTDSTGKVDRDEEGDLDTFGYGRVAVDRDIYVGVRAGGLVTPNTLLYAKGGYTNAKLNLVARRTGEELDKDYELDGWRLGAGVEQAFGNKAFVKLEYRYSNYDEAKFEFEDAGDDFETDEFGVDTDRHQVVVGAGIRF